PVVLGILSSSHEALGDSADADQYARAMEVAVSHQPGAYHRGWALFLLDHQRQVERIKARALEELKTRKDIYGYDVAAWALHQAGDNKGALAFADSALALGTRDAMLHLHAARIALALGDTLRAGREASDAAAINPWYRPADGLTMAGAP